MKKLFLISLFLLVGFMACKKESFIDDDFAPIEQASTKITFENPQELSNWLNKALGREEFRPEMFQELFQRSSQPICYDGADLLSFLAEYGLAAVDYIPGWNNYFQDANCNVAQWQYFGYERDEETSNGVNSDLVPDSVVWNVSGGLVTTYGDESLFFQTYMLDPETLDTIPNPNCPGTFQPPCNGGHDATVTVYINGAVYQRSAAGWAQVNNVPESIAPYCAPYGSGYSEPSGALDFECFCPIEFDEYQFLIDSGLEWDLDGSGYVNTTDLLTFLVSYGC